ncbi:ThiF family adenylyltransferase [Dyella ginsengisoli]|uniref:ThiF family adenylyltransferase n=1 Tax=Dyella ginsengisoli TaxID=363848 RepID=UPI000346EC96|nr:ThiF family adenylyltransferase [Dyella ginsengisoli]
MNRFELTAAPVDLAAQREALKHPGSGGFCAFEGWVRNNNEGREVSGLEYEAYTELAIAEGERVLAEATERYGVLAASAVHRVGNLAIGDLAVWIGVSAPHRDEAFRACRYIIDEIKHRLPIWKKEHYLEGDHAWVACSHTERAHEMEPPHAHGHHHHPHAVVPAKAGTQCRQAVTRESLDPSVRWGDEQKGFAPDYSRQVRLREVGEDGQRKLANARVLVIGAGGLGVPVISYLAGAGVGTLGIVDGDVLDASNLHRQVMYDARDIGQRKVDLAARRVARLNPSVEVVTYEQPLHAGDITDVFAGYDLVVECTDDLASRYLANDAAVLTSTPLVLASVYQYEGQLQVVTAEPGEPCLRCLWPDPPAPALAGSCVESGVLGPVPGVLGTMQAMEALKLLLGLPQPADHALQLVNLLDGTSQRLPIDASRGCALHGGCVAVARRALERTHAEGELERHFERLEEAVHAGYAIVDVREADEIDATPLHVTSLRVPSGEISAYALVHLERPVLLVCASGRRSAHAARLLREQGVDAWSLAGGIAALAPA